MDTTKTRILFEGLDERKRTMLSVFPEEIQRGLDTLFRQIKSVKFLKPDGKPDPKWKLFQGKTWEAARNAAREAARCGPDAGGEEMLWSAARAVVRAAKTTTTAAVEVAASTAWSIAREATAKAADKEASWNAGVDATLHARYLAVSYGYFPDKERYWQHVKDRWEVWQKGYALFCDVNGTLYVYCKSNQTCKRRVD